MLGSYTAHEILTAVVKNDIAKLKTLLDSSPNCINEKSSGTTALCKAAYLGEMAIVQLLVERGAKLDIADDNGGTPLMNAFLSKDMELVEYLIDQHEIQKVGVDEKSKLHLQNLVNAKNLKLPPLEVSANNTPGDNPYLNNPLSQEPIVPIFPELNDRRDGEITYQREPLPSHYPIDSRRYLRIFFIVLPVITLVALGLAYMTIKLRYENHDVEIKPPPASPAVKPAKTTNQPVAPTAAKKKIPDAAALAAKGIQLINQADYKNAVINLKQAIHLQPGVADWYYQLGRASSQTKDKDTAVWAFNQYKILAPKGQYIADIEARLSQFKEPTKERSDTKRHKKKKVHKARKRSIKETYGEFPNIRYFKHNGHVYYKDLETGSTYLAD